MTTFELDASGVAGVSKLKLPRKGYPKLTAFMATNLASPPSASSARAMLGKLSVVLVVRPSDLAFCTKLSGVALSLTTTASPPMSCRASRHKPDWILSAKKPTADSAATAKTTDTISRLSSPDRRSRQRLRQPSVSANGQSKETLIGFKVQPAFLFQTLAELIPIETRLCGHIVQSQHHTIFHTF